MHACRVRGLSDLQALHLHCRRVDSLPRSVAGAGAVGAAQAQCSAIAGRRIRTADCPGRVRISPTDLNASLGQSGRSRLVAVDAAAARRRRPTRFGPRRCGDQRRKQCEREKPGCGHDYLPHKRVPPDAWDSVPRESYGSRAGSGLEFRDAYRFFIFYMKSRKPRGAVFPGRQRLGKAVPLAGGSARRRQMVSFAIDANAI